MILRLLVALIVAVGSSTMAAAQAYPSRPITVVIPFPAGGPLDFLLRTVMPEMEAQLGQTIIIENRPGATGNLGNAYVAKAPPDGYTLVMTATNIGVLPHVFSHLTYDPIKDFAVVGGVAESPTACVVNSASPIRSFADLINEAKVNPGKLTFGSSGNGSPQHLVGELIAKLNNVKFTHVPYKGGAPAVNDLLGNFLSFLCTSLSNVLTWVQNGQLRALAVTTGERSPMLPDIPTVKELGFGDINEATRFIILAPAQTPQPIMERLSSTLAMALAKPSVKDIYGKAAFEAITKTPDQVGAQIQEQYNLWGPVVRELNLKLE